MGRTVSLDQNAQYGLLSGLAGGTITSGDLLVLSESGYLSSPSATTSLASLNKTTAGFVTNTATYTAFNVNPSSGTAFAVADRGTGFSKPTTVLSNGKFLVALTGYNNIASNYSGFRIYSNTGALEINTDTSSQWFSTNGGQLSNGYQVQTIGNDRFALVSASSNTAYFSIKNNDGSGVVGQTNLTTALIGSSQQLQLASLALANGNLLAIYHTTSAGLVFQIINPSGTAVVSQTVIDSTTGQVTSPACCNLNSGDWVVTWYDSANTRYRFARYNQSGVLQGSVVNFTSGNGIGSTGGADNLTGRIWALSNGGFVVKTRDNGGGLPLYYIRDASGAAVTSFTIPTNISLYGGVFGTITNQSSISYSVAPFQGGFAIKPVFSVALAAGSGGPLYDCFVTFDNTGNVTGTYSFVARPSVTSTNGNEVIYGGIASRGNAGFVVNSLAFDSGSGQIYNAISAITTAGAIQGSTLVLSNGNVGYFQGLDIDSGGNLNFFSTSGNAGSQYNVLSGNYGTLRSSVFGVATNSAVLNGTVTAATVGNYSINQTFLGTLNSDQRTAVVPGPKIVVSGNRAWGFGF